MSKIYDDDLDEDLDYNDYDDYDDGYKDSHRSYNYDENDYSYDDEEGYLIKLEIALKLGWLAL